MVSFTAMDYFIIYIVHGSRTFWKSQTWKHCKISSAFGSWWSITRYKSGGMTIERIDMTYPSTLQSLAGGGFLYLGRCIPSVCSEEDVKLGWTNFFLDFLQTTNETLNATIPSPYIMTPLNCHTEDEESKLVQYW